jgi:hypothetical protein
MAELNDDVLELRYLVASGLEERAAAAKAKAAADIASAAKQAKEEEARIADAKAQEENAKKAEAERVEKEKERKVREEQEAIEKAALDKELAERAMEDARIEAEKMASAMAKAIAEAEALLIQEAAARAETEEIARLEEEARNPYATMSYDQLSVLIRRTSTEVEEAAAAKNYKLCSTLEVTLNDMTVSRSKLPVPEQKLTRAEVLEKIATRQVSAAICTSESTFILTAVGAIVIIAQLSCSWCTINYMLYYRISNP